MLTVERGSDEVDESRSLPRASETVNHDHDLPRADKKIESLLPAVHGA